MKKCSHCGDNYRVIKGYCQKHYLQIKKHGRIKETKGASAIEIFGDIARIKLLKRDLSVADYAIIDIDDIEKVKEKRWCLTYYGYAVTHEKKINGIFLHHIIIGKKPQKGYVVDHINRDKLDNRKINLRFVSHGANRMNGGVFKNVHWQEKSKKWRVKVGQKFFGSFSSFDEAVKKRNEEIEKYMLSNARSLDDAVAHEAVPLERITGLANSRLRSARHCKRNMIHSVV